jgi:hypothetical protein
MDGGVAAEAALWTCLDSCMSSVEPSEQHESLFRSYNMTRFVHTMKVHSRKASRMPDDGAHVCGRAHWRCMGSQRPFVRDGVQGLAQRVSSTQLALWISG